MCFGVAINSEEDAAGENIAMMACNEARIADAGASTVT